jgi:hypothetical protein
MDEDIDFVYDNHETATVNGGTGRFAGATGTFYLDGLIDFTSFPDFSLPYPATGDLNCRLEQKTIESARLICASQPAFI